MDSSGGQRADVADKYAPLYHLIAQVIKLTISKPIENKFNFLLDMVAGVWGAAMAGNLDAAGLTFAKLQEAAERYNASAVTWFQSGVEKNDTLGNFVRAEWALSREILARHTRNDCRLVLDLGCGWGRRLYQFWSDGGPRGAFYAGGDRPRGSQDCVNALAGLFPEIRAAGFQFDFLAPDFRAIPAPQDGQVLVFTYNAVEQVHRLGRGLFDALLQAFPQAHITCVHIEPVSFQLPGQQTDNPQGFARDREYAERLGYNIDLYEQIAGNPLIRLIEAAPATLDTRSGNSRAVLVWETLPR